MTESVCPAPDTARPMCGGTYNTDVVTLTNNLNRFVAEAYMSESASVHFVMEADLVRFQSYIDRMVATQQWVVAQPQVDNPSVYPRYHKIPVWADVPEVESDSIRTMIRGLETARDELIMCQSSRISSGLLLKDNERLTLNLQRTQALLNIAITPDGTDYTATTPLVPVLNRNFSLQA